MGGKTVEDKQGTDAGPQTGGETAVGINQGARGGKASKTSQGEASQGEHVVMGRPAAAETSEAGPFHPLPRDSG